MNNRLAIIILAVIVLIILGYLYVLKKLPYESTYAPISSKIASSSASSPVFPGTPEIESQIVELVKKQATQSAVPQSSAQIVSVTTVEWPDSSLGCPKPGFAYSQIVTPGYKVTVNVGGKQSEYHTDLSGNVVLCN